MQQHGAVPDNKTKGLPAPEKSYAAKVREAISAYYAVVDPETYWADYLERQDESMGRSDEDSSDRKQSASGSNS